MDMEDDRTMDVDVGTAVHAVAVGTANERRAAAAAEIFMIIAQVLALEVYTTLRRLRTKVLWYCRR